MKPARSTFALTRPLGHHAQIVLHGGYGSFNTATIAAKYLLEHRRGGTIAILDIEYHHGSGSRYSKFYTRTLGCCTFPCMQTRITGCLQLGPEDRQLEKDLILTSLIPPRTCTDMVCCDALQQAVELAAIKYQAPHRGLSHREPRGRDNPICEILLTNAIRASGRLSRP
ncbi:hypothetical protein BC628DRAFT_1193410 [Trametes gibbosa]|nr:hypothetical protein BC628DRAFT_1193410 [Trametes gibbosa]